MSPPLFQRVIDHIVNRIESGEWPPGHQLPPIIQLAKDCDVGQTTVKTALMMLRERGVVRGQQGKATYVAERSRES